MGWVLGGIGGFHRGRGGFTMVEVGFNCLDFSLIFCGFLCMVVVGMLLLWWCLWLWWQRWV